MNAYKINVPGCKTKKTAWGAGLNSAINRYYTSNIRVLKAAGITRIELRWCNN